MDSTERPSAGRNPLDPPHDPGRATRARLASGFLVIKNAALTIGASGLIAVIGLVAVPLLVDRLGTARFGVLTLAWVVIGYASAFDLGLGRALTKLTAERLGASQLSDIPRLFWTAVIMLAALGVTSGAVIAAISGLLTNDVLAIQGSLVPEAQATFILLGCTVPFVLVGSALRGSLEAHQRFDLTNGIAVPLSLLSYFGPVAIAFITTDLPVVVSAVCASRVAATALTLYLCVRIDPPLRTAPRVDRSFVGPLLRYGGWITVSSIIVGIMLTADRFIIGATLSTAAVAFYATPYEGTKQMLVVSEAFANVLFPGFAANVGRDRIRTERLFSRGVRASFAGLFPLALIASVLSYEILDIWINREFAVHGAPVLQLLAAGALINGIAFVAFALIQSVRPDIIVKIATVEMVIFLALLWLLLSLDGIRGAAIAVLLRATGDTTVLYVFTRRLHLVSTAVLLGLSRMALSGLAVIGIGALLPSTEARVVYVVVVLACFVPICWRYLLTTRERKRLRERLARARESTKWPLKRSAPDTV
jgi:O-antigen/teichoic acid export membrane protein